jgi:hypothetical protein
MPACSYNAQMKTVIIVAFGFLSSLVPSTVYTQSDKSSPAIALVGGTLIDVSNSGHSTRDVRNAAVVLRDGKIEAPGLAASVKIPPLAVLIHQNNHLANHEVGPARMTIFGSHQSFAESRRQNCKVDFSLTLCRQAQTPHLADKDGAVFRSWLASLFAL